MIYIPRSRFYCKQIPIGSDNTIQLLDSFPIILRDCTLSIKSYILSAGLQDMSFSMGESSDSLETLTTISISKLSLVEIFRQWQFTELRLDRVFFKSRFAKTGCTTIVSLTGTFDGEED